MFINLNGFLAFFSWGKKFTYQREKDPGEFDVARIKGRENFKT